MIRYTARDKGQEMIRYTARDKGQEMIRYTAHLKKISLIIYNHFVSYFSNFVCLLQKKRKKSFRGNSWKIIKK
jgi:hypothetical protein